MRNGSNGRPPHPGRVLLEQYLKPHGLTQTEAARRMHMPLNRLNELIAGKRGMTPATALRLAALLKTTPEYWLQLQNAVDLDKAKQR